MAQRGIASFFKRPAGAPAAPEPAPAPAPKIQQASKNPAPVKAVVQPKRMRLITDDESDDEDQTSTLAEAALEASDAQDRAAADAAAAASAASAAPEVLGRGRSTRATRRRAVSDDEEEDQAAAPVKPTAAPALAQSSVLHDDAEQTPATEHDSSTPMEVEEPKALPASPAKPASSTGFAVAASKSNKAQSMMEFLGKKPAPAAAAAKSSSSKDKSTKSAPATKLSAAPNSHASKSTTAEASAATAMDTSDAAAPASSPRKDNPSAATVAAADEDQAAESLLDMDAQDMSQDAADPVPQELPKPTSFLFGGKQAAKEVVINYTPDAPGYHPIKDAFWKQDELVPYAALAKTFEAIGSTTKRLKIIETLANFFRSVIILSPNDLVRCVYMCTNRIAPPYEGLELGIGESLLMKAIADATGRDMRRIKADAEAKGDLGIVAKESRSSQKTMFAHKTLTVEAVFKNLREIASMTGHSVMSKKIVKIKAMLVACKESESMFLIRSLAGKLRIGLAEQSVLAALARAILLTPPRINPAKAQVVDASKSMSEADLAAELERATLAVKTVYCELPNYDVIIPTLLEVGLEELQVRCTLTPGIPLKPMLAHPTKGVSEVLKRFEGMTFTCEYKYDGERAQARLFFFFA
ncbi:DNA ligase 1 [Capsaspora owczarzaki ATCC 30864]|uniref:DNA ligase 1 n=1 Tax=Capsaspora owczarzaki (strain ATCC 30864) TaxID=595528 RepID=A0A0D2WU15_CAPO3|nr:DNA ligase 1 [Capsaspora owczarzaki ATCC 30864]